MKRVSILLSALAVLTAAVAAERQQPQTQGQTQQGQAQVQGGQQAGQPPAGQRQGGRGQADPRTAGVVSAAPIRTTASIRRIRSRRPTRSSSRK